MLCINHQPNRESAQKARKCCSKIMHHGYVLSLCAFFTARHLVADEIFCIRSPALKN